jgi:hypothetical protein
MCAILTTAELNAIKKHTKIQNWSEIAWNGRENKGENFPETGVDSSGDLV